MILKFLNSLTRKQRLMLKQRVYGLIMLMMCIPTAQVAAGALFFVFPLSLCLLFSKKILVI